MKNKQVKHIPEVGKEIVDFLLNSLTDKINGLSKLVSDEPFNRGYIVSLEHIREWIYSLSEEFKDEQSNDPIRKLSDDIFNILLNEAKDE